MRDNILIQVAMEEEFIAYDSILRIPGVFYEIQSIQGVRYNVYKYQNVVVYLSMSGIGRVNASYTLMTMIRLLKKNFNLVISGGTCASVQQQDIVGAVVKPIFTRYGDFDLRPLGHELGQVPGQPCVFKAKDGCKKSVMITYESFVEHSGIVTLTTNPKAYVDMETSSIAHICNRVDASFITIRGISDILGKDNANTFKESVKEASLNAALETIEYINSIY